jgi:ABC-2 type transport system ATP-binding protein
MTAIQTHNLTKNYDTPDGPFTALDSLDLTVETGEIMGYLGPNGAGKTTTIRMLLDIIRPTNGEAKILGMDAQQEPIAVKRRVGFLPAELALWRGEKSIDIIKYFGRIRGNIDMAYVNQLAQRLQFDVEKRVRDYSTGNKRKLGLILAMMNKPDLLILDEPTSGLDPLMQQTFNAMMREFRDEGKTVFLSSHTLSEVQAICDRVAVLRQGVLEAVERVDSLMHAQFRWVTVSLDDPQGIDDALRHTEGVTDISQRQDGTYRLRLTGDFDPLLRTINDRYVKDIQVDDPTLEEVFLAFYDDQAVASGNGKGQQKEMVR